MSDAILLVGHGSRTPAANTEFEALAAAYRTVYPQKRVEVAYIELAHPLLADALAKVGREARRIVVVPVFLFAAGHVKTDIPLAVARARYAMPDIEITVAGPLGVHVTMVDLAFARATQVLSEDASVRAKTLLLVVGRGASDPDANGDFCKVARLIGEGRDLMHVEPTFMGITQPSVERSLDWAARLRPDRLVVLPYLLFGGRLVERLERMILDFRASHPWIRAQLAPHLGMDGRLVEALDDRVQQALRGDGQLPCDMCHHRVEIGGASSQVGGLRALLYSVRHALTHAQAETPVHLHRPLKKHVLVCGNADCVDRGSIGVLEALRRVVRAQGCARQTKVTRTSCMGRCGEGPTVAVYPDGVWYRGVVADDAQEIVTEHLIADRLVGRLVGDILQ